MQNTRREFIKNAALFSGGAGILKSLPPSVQKAMVINPDKGSTFYDAEHVVLLMQENRSFDHLFGTLQGVRGFNDPRVVKLPNKNLAWFQSNEKGETYAPFRLDIKDTEATWMGDLPHSWYSQVDARNNGRYDKWLEAKRSGNKKYHHIPLTLGHYNREDLPFYYSLADAFTVCDQHFCASLTATTPNRLFFFTGTVRETPDGNSPANVLNPDVYYDSPASWTTFPERLEDAGVSWKIYQNEISLDVGLKGREPSWLANFTNNPLEWFSQYHVRFFSTHIRYMKNRARVLEDEIQKLDPASGEREKRARLLNYIRKNIETYSPENFKELSKTEQEIHNKAFITNLNDPFYHELESLKYNDEDEEREMEIPKGDVFDQFRKDVENDNLPAVSWLIAPANFSDHPGAPWYGAWYVSEVLDILTRNPDIWKKTIFILTYDENDGYYDHIPPFTAPNPEDSLSGKCSSGIDTTVDYVTKTQLNHLEGNRKNPGRVSPIGLGYRVPLVVASPWSRGGWVNSQVFDNTSVLMFLEKFLSKKIKKQVKEENISPWRRAVCGDLTSVFRPYNGEEIKLPKFIEKKPFVESIYNAKFNDIPSGYKSLTKEEIDKFNKSPLTSSLIPDQEKGIRPACALPYQLYTSGNIEIGPNGKVFKLKMEVGNEYPGEHKVGAPFTVYDMKDFAVRNFAVKSSDTLTDEWIIQKDYHFELYGPNGFFRVFQGNDKDPKLNICCEYERKRLSHRRFSGNIDLKLSSSINQPDCIIEIVDNAYNKRSIRKKLTSGKMEIVPINLKRSYGWYDFTVKIKGNTGFERRFAGHVETNESSFTDPYMGRVSTNI